MPNPSDELSYNELNFWERAFLARASTNGGLAPSTAAQDCADFANSAVFQASTVKIESRNSNVGRKP